MKNIICKHCGRFLNMSKKERKGLCDKHYLQQLKYGFFLDNIQRTKNDPNKIISYDDYALVELYDINGTVINYAIIDLDDIELISKYKWSYHKGYATTKDKKTRKEIGMHNLIMNVQDREFYVDHIIHNDEEKRGLDNRKSNLRIVNPTQNVQNSKKSIRNTSGVKGVNWDKKRNKWRVRITIDGKRIELGWFDNKEDAVKVREETENKYWGEYGYKE